MDARSYRTVMIIDSTVILHNVHNEQYGYEKYNDKL